MNIHDKDQPKSITFDPEANPGLMMPYGFINDTLAASELFNAKMNPEQGQYLLQEFYDFADAMKTIPGYGGVFGTGHPFYALQPDNGVTSIPEIGRFVGETRDKTLLDSWRYAGKWACGSCQVQNNLTDLKSSCKPCDIVDLKPRDIFKALPDLDFWVVVEENNESVESLVEQRSQQAGFYQSDMSIYRSVRDTNRVLQALNSGRKPNARLPIDLHIVTRESLVDAISSLEDLNIQSESYYVPIQPRSLHVNWEQADEPYNFTHDFLFSLTEYDLTDDVQEKLMQTRRNMGARFTNGQIFHAIFENDAKSARQLTDSTMMKILATRLNHWREV